MKRRTHAPLFLPTKKDTHPSSDFMNTPHPALRDGTATVAPHDLNDKTNLDGPLAALPGTTQPRHHRVSLKVKILALIVVLLVLMCGGYGVARVTGLGAGTQAATTTQDGSNKVKNGNNGTVSPTSNTPSTAPTTTTTPSAAPVSKDNGHEIPTFMPTSKPQMQPSQTPTPWPTRRPAFLPSTTKSPTSAQPTTSHPSTSSQPTAHETSSPTLHPSTVTSSPTQRPSIKSPTTRSPIHTPTIHTTAPTTEYEHLHAPTPATKSPTSHSPTRIPTTKSPTTHVPTSLSPTHSPVTQHPSHFPTTRTPTNSRAPTSTSTPTNAKTTSSPTTRPTNLPSTKKPTKQPSLFPSQSPLKPTVKAPTHEPTIPQPTVQPTVRTAYPTIAYDPNAPVVRLGRKSNVLMIICDDLKTLVSSFETTPYTRDTRNTPNIDKLAARGMSFMNAHAQMSMCGPSRASFLTSLRPDTTRIYTMPPNALDSRINSIRQSTGQVVMTIPRLFRSYGYASYGFGKIFHDNEINQMISSDNWDVPVFTFLGAPFQQYPRPPSIGSPYVGRWISSMSGASDMYYPDGQTAAMAGQLIQKLSNETLVTGKPWFVAVGFFKPHLPWSAPQKYFDMAPPLTTCQTAFNVNAPSGIAQADFLMIRGGSCEEVSGYPHSPTNLAAWTLSPIDQASAMRAYYAVVLYLDAQVGRLMDALDSSAARDTTHVILFGDHGFHLGDHGLYCKHTNFEQATHVPLIVSPALVEGYAGRGQRSFAPVELLDIMPTLAELTTLPNSNPSWYPWEGTSLMPILNNPTSFTKAAAVSQYFRGNTPATWTWGFSLRTVRYRFTVWSRVPVTWRPNFYKALIELYDYVNDPWETVCLTQMRPDLVWNFTLGPGMGWQGGERFQPFIGLDPFDAAEVGNVAAQADVMKHYI